MLARARRWTMPIAMSILLSLASQGIARAAEGTDESAVKAVISKQLDAFKHDDAATAYGFAAPDLKSKFPDAAAFMTMVKKAYQPVYRPKSVVFGEFKKDDPGWSQSLSIIDEEGQAWTAIYSLERGPDGKLIITGCSLVKRPEINV